MALREYEYIKGSTVQAPQRKNRISKPNRKYKQIQRRKKLINKNTLLKNKRKNDRKYILTVMMLVFSCGFLTIWGDSRIYNMQKKMSELNAEISKTQEENEAIKVTLLKFSSLKNIQEKASTKLSMHLPNKEEVAKIDVSEDYFKDVDTKSYENSTKEINVFSKFKNLFK